MIIKVYSVFDKTAETYATPFFAPNDEVAKRNFRYSLKKLDDMFISDLVLFCVGAFHIGMGRLLCDTKEDKYQIDSGENVLSEREIEKKNSEVKQQ